MTVPATFSFDAPGDAARAAELRRVKALATLVLAGTLALFVTAKLLLPLHPIFGFVAAFAEAATIGGLADWYAVLAVFKRPLGLPIPHTAIIQSNQARIADKLGEFIQVHFLEAGPVEAKLNEIDFGSFVADWLRDRKRSDDLARFALRLLPEAFSATVSSGLMTFIIRRMSSQLQALHLLTFVDRLGTDQAYIDRIDGLKRNLFARPELADLARTVWANTRSFIERSASGETQVLQHHLAGMCVAAGEALAGDAELRGEINKGLVTVLRSFVADQKSGVSTFISDQVKAWDMAQLISLIEINIGRDLQYIRFNGSLIARAYHLIPYTIHDPPSFV